MDTWNRDGRKEERDGRKEGRKEGRMDGWKFRPAEYILHGIPIVSSR